MRHFGDKRGFTLPLTIVLLIVIGILSFSLYDMVKRERIESFHRYQAAQAILELESGVNYAFNRMQYERKPWRSDSLHHISSDSSISFSLSHFQDGAYSKIHVYNHDSSHTFSAHTGFIQDNRPALTVLAPQANISLVGNAKIEGGIAIQNGSVSYSTHYKMRADKDAFFDTVYIGKATSIFDTLRFYPDLSRNQFKGDFQNERCVFDGNELVGGAQNSKESCKTVIMQGDSRCENCTIYADRIFVRERASLQNANFISRTISLKDSIRLSGIFFAQDTMEVALAISQENAIRLVVQGRKTGDVTYAGLLNLKKIKASDALVIFMGDNWDETMKGIPVNVSDQVDIRGSIIANGTTNFQGRLAGQMMAYNLGFFEDNTLWRGFLKNGTIKADTTVHSLVPDIVFLGGEASYEK